MNSTLLRTATPAVAHDVIDTVLLPAATAAPAALVIAVDLPVSQETSVLSPVVCAQDQTPAEVKPDASAHAFYATGLGSATPAVVRPLFMNAVGAPPSRGTPV